MSEGGLTHKNLAKKSHELIMSLAEEDHLTGINNRRGVLKESTKIIKTLKRESAFRNFSVMFLDMIGLKQLNIDFGEGGADKFVVEAANLISDNTRPNDVVGRWGGDEFVIIQFNTDDDKENVVAKRIREKSTDKVKFNILFKDFDMDDPLEESIDKVANKIEAVKALGKIDEKGRSTGNGVVVDLNKINV